MKTYLYVDNWKKIRTIYLYTRHFLKMGFNLRQIKFTEQRITITYTKQNKKKQNNHIVTDTCTKMYMYSVFNS